MTTIIEELRADVTNVFALKHQRDDLLAALENMIAAYQGDLSVPERKTALHNARAAIAKAKGA